MMHLLRPMAFSMLLLVVCCTAHRERAGQVATNEARALEPKSAEECNAAVTGAVLRDTAGKQDKEYCKCPKYMLPKDCKTKDLFEHSRKFDPKVMMGKGCACKEAPGSHCYEIKSAIVCKFTSGCKCDGAYDTIGEFFGCGTEGCEPA
eukprot:TRINITY_DN47968_c0_g1_i1.p1 TRINITY_DN47968_c0_g1~~TRINITY_DN47968_c0_g1_i1.p1  ORF type:complete len:148 (-),score=23.16 TRINITY_DN47968_c0_g1_i1:104-547(-)